MPKEEKPTSFVPTPMLEISEFEEEASSILDSAQKEASKIMDEAKLKADETIREEKVAASKLEKEYSVKLEEELNLEKERLILKTKEELQRIQSIPEERILKAVSYVLEKLMPEWEKLSKKISI